MMDSSGVTLHRVTTIRSREHALALLIPKFLGVLWEIGSLDSEGVAHGKVIAHLGSDLELGALILYPGAFEIHAYGPTARSPTTKVFSAHLISRMAQRPPWKRPSQATYLGGQCMILSWKRGEWEDRILAAPGSPRTIQDLANTGLAHTAAGGKRGVVDQ